LDTFSTRIVTVGGSTLSHLANNEYSGIAPIWRDLRGLATVL
jgi:hypothetical protein